ncbi:MAG TPA: hypothetical protein DEG17_01065 [Cyanobacteria bacterium UBA11149]|nr:hypothetical protein [Cyanobacteria bacterium UBA11367]HBE59068.1 hypothetical protein [Cyanobacteria bacterium UBA11366]HBK66603.1 hypothetical protein [Cyanobacteria bacterium UBA11166]HBR72748.1 hypothetical protein [Cyanobacteria bacterium UBA11159]HBS67925.1 hypothetical protein [Cyanobacteria bacterium UBA11153]HBW87504.1 hypothetical protein [Cyanobacteria bacterium UBA11149]HCA94034.1 hypothetical protein [Cyanobacteria bacterium UBA9226]
MKIERIYFYTISGIFSALIGWNLSQLLIVDILKPFTNKPLPFNPDFIVLPITAVSFAVAAVITEIFLSNPTRYKANRRVLPPFIWVALATGTVAGLIASSCTWILYKTGATDSIVRIVSWSLVGLFTGLGEGISWRFRSIEGSTSKATQRIWKATISGLIAGIVAAILVEILRNMISLGGYEDPISFCILGLSLGLFLSVGTAPTYLVALRAGWGFEAIDPRYGNNNYPCAKLNQSSNLRFVTLDEDEDIIEEGLSIQLPSKTNKPITIGSDSNADIIIPHIPEKAASLTISQGNVKLRCHAEGAVQIQSRRLVQKQRPISLMHNQILTFFHADNDNKFYRFVFYDRFLDPEA